jgi:hypothetical protein
MREVEEQGQPSSPSRRSRGSLHPHRGGVGAAAPVRVSAGLSPRRRPLLGDLDGGPPPSLPASSLPPHLAISFRLHARAADPLLWPREVGSARGVHTSGRALDLGYTGSVRDVAYASQVPRCRGKRQWRTGVGRGVPLPGPSATSLKGDAISFCRFLSDLYGRFFQREKYYVLICSA